MTLLLLEGFDHSSYANIGYKSWLSEYQNGSHEGNSFMATGRITGYCIVLFSGGSGGGGGTKTMNFRKLLPTTATTAILGTAIKMPPSGEFYTDLTNIMGFTNSGSSIIASIRVDSSQRPYIVNSAGTTIATAVGFQALPSVWNYYEMKIVVNGASGSCELRINGSPNIAPTPGDFGTTPIGGVRYQVLTPYGPDWSISLDDVYVVDTGGSAPHNTFLGDCHVECIVPTSAGATTAWTANTGANWAAVDELASTYPDGDTTYVSSNTPGDIDTYTCSNVVVSSGVVYGVQTNLYGRKDDSGLRQIAAVIRQGGTNYVGSNKTLSASYVFGSEIWPLDPLGAAWTVANVNADEFGVKETS